MVCGAFKEGINKHVELGDVEQAAFGKVLRLACAESVHVKDIAEAVQLAQTADRFQMSTVLNQLTEVVRRLLSVEACADVLSCSVAGGPCVIEAVSRNFALKNFGEVAATDGFMGLSEETLSSLVEDDFLATESEEGVFEAVTKWMQGGKEGIRGEDVLRKVRFALIDGKYLATTAKSLIPSSELLDRLVLEAALFKLAPSESRGLVKLQHSHASALVPRCGRAVSWELWVNGGERRLAVHQGDVYTLAECMGSVCSSDDGSIRIWSKSTLEEVRVLHWEDNDNADGDCVLALTSWEGRLISGHGDGKVRVWDVSSGQCEFVLDAHSSAQRRICCAVQTLAVCGARLLSGAQDNTIRIWGMGAGGSWPCERTLVGHTGGVNCLAVLEGKAMSGSFDKSIRVWNVESGAHEATLEGHTGSVTNMVVHGRRLISAAQDGTLRVWGVGTWELLRTVVAYSAGSSDHISCLTVSGWNLVGGSSTNEYVKDQYEACVWDLESLECRHTIRLLEQPKRPAFSCLLRVGDEVWAGVGDEIVIWGRT